MTAALTASICLLLLLGGIGSFGSDAARSSTKSAPQLFHLEWNQMQETDQSWRCWTEGYRPNAANANKIHETTNGTEAALRRILGFNQSTTVLFMANSNSDNQNLRTEFTITPNRMVRLALDNVGLERLEIGPFVGSENDCRLADLSVPRNRLREVPQGLDRLTVLRKLDMRQNALVRFPLDRLSKATQLKRLLLAHNQLEAFVTEDHVSFEALQELDLSHNRLKALDSTRWSAPALASFHVDHNRALTAIEGWSKARFPLVRGFDPAGTNNWNQTWLKSVQ
uniref:Putative membrane glycoprotein lig-1 n=1 Tax=Anopheles braziliensis TaxID=58242 RepID=A0A2M3ZC84_9DIPT